MEAVQKGKGSVLGFVMCAVAFVIGLVWWRQAIPLFLLWTLVEGGLRRWFLLDWQRFILFTGCMMLLGAYARYFAGRVLRRDRFNMSNAVTTVILFYFIFALLQAFNPSLPSPLIGPVALFIHFIYVPMAYMVPVSFGTVRRFARFMLPYVYLSLPLVVLAHVQFRSPQVSLVNRVMFEGGLMPIAAEFVRASATFTTVFGFGHYLNFVVVIALFLIGLPHLRRWSWSLGLVVAVALYGVLMTATRGNVLPTWASAAVFVVVSLIIGRGSRRTYALVTLTGAALLALVIVGTETGGDVWRSFFARLTGGVGVDRTVDRFVLAWTPFRVLPYAGFAGHGTGITHGGLPSLVPRVLVYLDQRVDDLLIHDEAGKMLYELGIGGFILVLLVRFLFMGMAIRLFWRSKSPEHRLLSLAVILFQLPPVLFLEQVTYMHSMSRWWWLMAGVLFLIEREQKAAGQQQATPAFARPWFSISRRPSPFRR